MKTWTCGAVAAVLAGAAWAERGITPEQSAMVAKIASDLARMRKDRQSYQSLRGKILERWRAEEKGRGEEEGN